eukprot:5394443-Pleurochrysis_carterae.AAC.1
MDASKFRTCQQSVFCAQFRPTSAPVPSQFELLTDSVRHSPESGFHALVWQPELGKNTTVSLRVDSLYSASAADAPIWRVRMLGRELSNLFSAANILDLPSLRLTVPSSLQPLMEPVIVTEEEVHQPLSKGLLLRASGAHWWSELHVQRSPLVLRMYAARLGQPRPRAPLAAVGAQQLIRLAAHEPKVHWRARCDETRAAFGDGAPDSRPHGCTVVTVCAPVVALPQQRTSETLASNASVDAAHLHGFRVANFSSTIATLQLTCRFRTLSRCTAFPSAWHRWRCGRRCRRTPRLSRPPRAPATRAARSRRCESPIASSTSTSSSTTKVRAARRATNVAGRHCRWPLAPIVARPGLLLPLVQPPACMARFPTSWQTQGQGEGIRRRHIAVSAELQRQSRRSACRALEALQQTLSHSAALPNGHRQPTPPCPRPRRHPHAHEPPQTASLAGLHAGVRVGVAGPLMGVAALASSGARRRPLQPCLDAIS